MKAEDAPKERGKQKSKKHSNWRWVVTIFFVTIAISSTISFVSSAVMERASIVVATLVLLFIVALGIVFDIIGVAVMSAGEKPFHSMAAKKRRGAAAALPLLRNAEKVSSFCNDVVGDICGVVSGSASAVLAAMALQHFAPESVAQLIMSALIAGLTIAGKAIGKTFAMKQATSIVLTVAQPIAFFKRLFHREPAKKRRKP